MSDDDDDSDEDDFAPASLEPAAMEAYLSQHNEGALKLLNVIGVDASAHVKGALKLLDDLRGDAFVMGLDCDD